MTSTLPISLHLLLLLLLTTTNPNPIEEEASPATSNPSILASLQYPIPQSLEVLLSGNSTLSSPNRTFALGFFSTTNGGKPTWYLGIWYASIPVYTYVWVANRARPLQNISTSSALELTGSGRLVVRDSAGSVLWSSANTEPGVRVELLETGNLVLLAPGGAVTWQSFDYPTDTWLPGMNLTTERGLTSWTSYVDPAPGLYSLRLRPPDYGEFELVFNNSVVYWRTGNWTGTKFTNIPQMVAPYIYKFHFVDPFKPTASFGFTETALDNNSRGVGPPLTRFQMDISGQLRQFTWGTQTWNMFWSQPESKCRAFGLCGPFGVCSNNAATATRPCECLSGFKPADGPAWSYGVYSDGCRRVADDDGVPCDGRDDGFEKVGAVSYVGAQVKDYHSNSWDDCQRSCLASCYCIGVSYDGNTRVCKYYSGSLWNLSSDGGGVWDVGDVFYLRVLRSANKIKVGKALSSVVLSASIVGGIVGLGFVLAAAVLFVWRREKRREGMKKEEGAQLLPASNLKVFSYKELHTATRGFSDKLGHGGFGAVFHGELSDSTVVAVKRLDRPGGGEKEFQAEVCTIGNIQHINLARLRGFCTENSHRLLVYDYMPNGALSVYLRRDGPNLSWDVRFRLAVGMARGIAYLHEECRDCIIHCDIKPENILLDSDYAAKVSDFGLAKLLGRDFSRVLATMRGTWGYVAPEWISGVAITSKADVYSYGMTLIELLGGRRNVEAHQSVGGREGASQTTNSWFFPPWAAQQIIEGNVRAVLDDRLSCTYNIEEAERVALVAVWCIQDSEATRPTMGMVVKMLEGVVEVTVPPAPKLLQALVSGESFCGIKADSGNGLSNGSDFSGYIARLSSGGSESSIGNAFSVVNEIVHDNQRSSVGFTNHG